MYSYLENKRVAIVGPAASIKNSNKGGYIDDHDIVVRLNYSKIDNVVDTGQKTDIIYYDGGMDSNRFNTYLELNPKTIVCTYPETEWFFNERCKSNVSSLKEHFNSIVVDPKIYNGLKDQLNKNATTNVVRPNSGLIAIVDLLNSKLSELYIIGLDFYRTAYLDSQPDGWGKMNMDQLIKVFNKGDGGDVHDIDIQFEYFKKLTKSDSRIKPSKFLSNFL